MVSFVFDRSFSVTVASFVSAPLPSDTVKSLGVVLDAQLSFEAHIRSISKRSFFHLRIITKIRRFLSQGSVVHLIHAFVTSLLDYGNSLLTGLPGVRLDRLQLVQNAAVRLICGVKRYESIRPHMRRLHWLRIRQRIQYKIASLVYRCVHGLAPP